VTHAEAVQIFDKTLSNMLQWMDKAEEHATGKSFDVNVLATSRLAPDQFSFTQQVQAACDQAKYAAAYLGGQQPPSHPDTETNFAELRERVQKCKAFVESVKKYDGSESRKVSPPWLGGAWLTGDAYLANVAIPNFYFHATMAYAILRHNGVPLGKMDYIGSLPIQS
jgi:hypothetical protein